MYELYRGAPREAFFASLIVGYRLASVDPRVVGLDPVMPEDAYLPMTQFDEQMRMFEFMHTVYPKVHLSTHAELTLGLVPIEGLRHHIRDRSRRAHVDRIGQRRHHARDGRERSDEDDGIARVAVEIRSPATTSSSASAAQHPLKI
jgi:adenosine deaminase